MENIDYRLDLYNAVEKFVENMNEDNDSLFIVTRSKHADNFSALTGNLDLIYEVMVSNNIIDKPTSKQLEGYTSMQNFILNCASNILVNDEIKKQIFINAITNK